MIMSTDEIRQYCQSHPDVLALIMLEGQGEDSQEERILCFGPWKDGELSQ
jgi:hypothetical protein